MSSPLSLRRQELYNSQAELLDWWDIWETINVCFSVKKTKKQHLFYMIFFLKEIKEFYTFNFLAGSHGLFPHLERGSNSLSRYTENWNLGHGVILRRQVT